MTSLLDKLKSLGVPIEPVVLPAPPTAACAIEQLVPGRLEQTACGPTYLIEQHYPLTHQRGCASLRLTAPLQTIAAWLGQPDLCALPLESFCFVDAETTGLARGTGTYAFLIGLGRYHGETFQLLQFFMRDPAEEPALLSALQEALASCRVLVTFNGKTFDLPILNARWVTNGLPFSLADRIHLDLLSLARRLWRSSLPSRALHCLEEQILRQPRAKEDVPGWLIPQLYFDYLRDGDARPMLQVLEHNTIDILSMAALLSYIAELLADPLGRPGVSGLDQIEMGRLFADLGHGDLAAQLYKRALDGVLPHDARNRALEQWSWLEKRRDNLAAAIRLWQEAAVNGQIYAFIELAKVYEHRERDYAYALRWAQAAFDRINAPGYPAYERLRWADDLSRRLERLRQKLAGQALSSTP